MRKKKETKKPEAIKEIEPEVIKEGNEYSQLIMGIVKDMVGQVCTQVTFSYGDVLVLDFGPFTSKTIKSYTFKRGEWSFDTSATDWNLFKEGALIIDGAQVSDEVVLDANKQLIKDSLINKRLTKFKLNIVTLEVKLEFEDDYCLLLMPDLEEEELAHWELVLPPSINQILSVGPKLEANLYEFSKE